MNRRLLSSLTLLCLLLLTIQTAAQVELRGPGAKGGEAAGGENMLFGDFTIDESRAEGKKAATFQVILYRLSGVSVSRQTVSNGGRYYISNVPNGEYELVVEMDGTEVTRQRIMINSPVKSEIRQNIALEWRGSRVGSSTVNAGTVSIEDLYARSSDNKKLYEKATDALKKNDLDQAINLFTQVVNADARDYQAWNELGTAYFRKDKLSSAETALSKSLEAKPDYQLGLLNLGKVQFQRKNYETAIATLTKVIEKDPTSAQVNAMLGESYLQIKKGSQAVGYLNEAIRLDPQGMANLHLRLATLYHGAGLKDRAAAEYEAYLAKVPDHPNKDKMQKYIAENKK